MDIVGWWFAVVIGYVGMKAAMFLLTWVGLGLAFGWIMGGAAKLGGPEQWSQPLTKEDSPMKGGIYMRSFTAAEFNRFLRYWESMAWCLCGEPHREVYGDSFINGRFWEIGVPLGKETRVCGR